MLWRRRQPKDRHTTPKGKESQNQQDRSSEPSMGRAAADGGGTNSRGRSLVPPEYLCPLTNRLMRYTSTDLTLPRAASFSSFFFSRGTAFAFVLFREPVIGQDGHTYEKKAIEEWIKKKVRVLLAFI